MTRYNTSFILFVLTGFICFQNGESIFPDLLENVLRYKCDNYCVNLNSWTFIRNKLCPKFCPQNFTSTTAMPESTEVTPSTANTTSTTVTTPVSSASTNPAASTLTTTATSAGITEASLMTPSSAGMSMSSGVTTSMTTMTTIAPTTITPATMDMAQNPPEMAGG